jgi:hypothetical protein
MSQTSSLVVSSAASSAGEQRLGELALFAALGEHRLLVRSASHETRDRDRLVLPDPVRAIARLVFGGRVPPRIEVKHVVGRG